MAMAPGKARYLRQKAIQHLANVASFTAPTNFYVSLWLDAPEVDEFDFTPGLIEGTEVSTAIDTAYARQAVTFIAHADEDKVENNADVDFGPAVLVASPYTVRAFGIHDALTLGNFLWWGWMPGASGVDVINAKALKIPAGAIVLQEK